MPKPRLTEADVIVFERTGQRATYGQIADIALGVHLRQLIEDWVPALRTVRCARCMGALDGRPTLCEDCVLIRMLIAQTEQSWKELPDAAR